ncbi:MAG: Riboflavin transporter FmnP [Candidatus Izimaplasma bacterium HR2]|nr:MAG: Riboflavin transporter FmnP [Candidatus Izimaplasma bacterium HR2]
MTNDTKKMVTLGILSALGAILMIIEIPYPFVPFLMLDLSDVVVLVIFAFYGWKEAALVGLLKTIIHALTKGAVGPIFIGQITAFIASMSYVLGMYISANKLNLNRLLSAIVSVMVVTIILTTANYLFITPIWFGGTTFLDIKDWVTPDAFGLNVEGGYLIAILVAYVPFNLLKGAVITSAYFVVYKSIHYLNPNN